MVRYLFAAYSLDPSTASYLDEGRLRAERPRAWVNLFNLRCRLLLGYLLHGLHLPGFTRRPLDRRAIGMAGHPK